jgi:hypothetical protein
MTIAYLILQHHKERQYEWLFRAVYDRRDIFAVHVDKTASRADYRYIAGLAEGRPNIHLLPRRSIVWGGWSIAAVTLQAIEALLDLDSTWRYFVNLSGQDYQIRPIEEIRGTLAENPSLNYLQAYPIGMRPRRERAHLRRRMRWRCFEVGGRLVRTPIPMTRPRSKRVEWKGSGWYVLSREFCEWIVAGELTRDCVAALRGMYIPDEFLMQTLAMNSPFADTVTNDNRREIVWDGKSHPKVLTMENLHRLEGSQAFFARKFDETVDRDVLDALARRIGAPIPVDLGAARGGTLQQRCLLDVS